MGRLRSRAHSTQPGPIQIHQVIDTEGTGAPISAWTGGGSLRGPASGSGGNRGAAGSTAFSGQDSGFPAANLSFSTPTGPVQRQSQQYSLSSGQGGFSGLMDTSNGSQPMDHNTPQDPGCRQAADTHTTNDVATLTAQLVEAMAVVRSLQQQNQAMGAEMRDMRAKMHEERLERRRYLSGEHDAGRGAQVHSTPMDRIPPSGSGSRGWRRLARKRPGILWSTLGQVMRGYRVATWRGVSSR